MSKFKRFILSILILVGLYMLIHSYLAVGELDTRTYELKNCFDEAKAKHNKLVEIVHNMKER